MTRDDVIRMAKEAGLITGMHMSGVEIVGSCGGDGAPTLHITIHEMAHFAALVAEAETKELREKIGLMSRRRQAQRIAGLEAEIERWMAVAEALQTEVAKVRANAHPWPTTVVRLGA